MPRLPYPAASIAGLALIALILALNVGVHLLTLYPATSVFGDAWLELIPSSMAAHFTSYLGLWNGTGGIPWADLRYLVTYGYSHGGWDHLTFNMVPFVLLAWLTLRRNGSIGLFVLYHGMMVATVLVYVLIDLMALEGYIQTDTNYGGVIGASGAVHGLAGLWVTWAFRDRVGNGLHRVWPAALWLGFVAGANIWLVVTFGWGFAWELHVAGMVLGMMIALIIPARKHRSQARAETATFSQD